MVVIEGRGQSKVAGKLRDMPQFGSPQHSLEHQWYVIDQNVPHEFRPESSDMVVMSFHTVESADLIEVSTESGRTRRYQV